MSYTLTATSDFIVRDADGAWISANPGNADYQAYQVWLAAGNTPTPYTAPPVATPVPTSISDRQFFQQLALQGVITQAEALAAVQTGAIPAAMQPLIAALPAAEQFAAQMMISGATSFDRGNPFVAALGEAYGWTSAQLDALWIAAAQL